MSIASEITRLQNDSAAIAAAIAAKGVTVPAGSGYDDFASLIGQISGGGGGARVGTLEASGTQDVTLTFTGLQGKPVAFAVQSGSTNAADGDYMSLGTNRAITSVLCNGTTLYSIAGYKSGSTARIYLYKTCTYTYSNGTLTITSPGASTAGTFRSPTFKLIYAY